MLDFKIEIGPIKVKKKKKNRAKNTGNQTQPTRLTRYFACYSITPTVIFCFIFVNLYTRHTWFFFFFCAKLLISFEKFGAFCQMGPGMIALG